MNSIIPHSQILVATDDQSMAASIKSVLENNHFVVHVFSDPFLALTVFKDDPLGYNLIIYDIATKQLSAFEFLRQIREDNPDIKFILITTFEIKPAEFSKVLPSITIDGFLEKQSLQDTIVPTINKILGPRKIAKSNIGKYR